MYRSTAGAGVGSRSRAAGFAAMISASIAALTPADQTPDGAHIVISAGISDDDRKNLAELALIFDEGDPTRMLLERAART